MAWNSQASGEFMKHCCPIAAQSSGGHSVRGTPLKAIQTPAALVGTPTPQTPRQRYPAPQKSSSANESHAPQYGKAIRTLSDFKQSFIWPIIHTPLFTTLWPSVQSPLSLQLHIAAENSCKERQYPYPEKRQENIEREKERERGRAGVDLNSC